MHVRVHAHKRGAISQVQSARLVDVWRELLLLLIQNDRGPFGHLTQVVTPCIICRDVVHVVMQLGCCRRTQVARRVPRQ